MEQRAPIIVWPPLFDEKLLFLVQPTRGDFLVDNLHMPTPLDEPLILKSDFPWASPVWPAEVQIVLSPQSLHPVSIIRSLPKHCVERDIHFREILSIEIEAIRANTVTVRCSFDYPPDTDWPRLDYPLRRGEI